MVGPPLVCCSHRGNHGNSKDAPSLISIPSWRRNGLRLHVSKLTWREQLVAIMVREGENRADELRRITRENCLQRLAFLKARGLLRSLRWATDMKGCPSGSCEKRGACKGAPPSFSQLLGAGVLPTLASLWWVLWRVVLWRVLQVHPAVPGLV